jgi:hypothetical protein
MPEVGRGLRKRDANLVLGDMLLTDVNDLAFLFFSRDFVPEQQPLSRSHLRRQNNQCAVSTHHQRVALFGYGAVILRLPMHQDGDAQEHPLATPDVHPAFGLNSVLVSHLRRTIVASLAREEKTSLQADSNLVITKADTLERFAATRPVPTCSSGEERTPC